MLVSLINETCMKLKLTKVSEGSAQLMNKLKVKRYLTQKLRAPIIMIMAAYISPIIAT